MKRKRNLTLNFKVETNSERNKMREKISVVKIEDFILLLG